MSYHDYFVSQRIQRLPEVTFYGLIMAAMRKADTFNAALLREGFPHVWAELEERYDSPDGLLESER